jgi:DNA (cytosine-5)-methyltransferase 1
LFSSAGVGDLGLVANGINILASSELIEQRHRVYQANFQSTRCFTGDLWQHKDDLVDHVREQLAGEDLFLALATPPCQGMSTNGVGKLLAEIRSGNRPPIDERNRLIVPTMDVVTKLRPMWLVLENVPAMRNTIILNRTGQPTNLIDFIREEMGPEYVGTSEVVSCSDYGVPQVRKRLITIFTRDKRGLAYLRRNDGSFFKHSKRSPAVTVREAIGHLPPLDSCLGPAARPDVHPLHYVQQMSPEKHWWIQNTPEGETAFNNQCVSHSCLFQGNAAHVDRTAAERETGEDPSALYCEKCGSLLPRPSIVDERTGKRRLIRGFHSAYRRMRWDEPARALTRNFPFEASDNKIHPDQHRTLSIYEAMILQTIADYNFTFEVNGKCANRKVIADVIGESVPPRLIDFIAQMILAQSSHCDEGLSGGDALAA